MTWKHVACLALGSTLAVVGALTGTAVILAPLASTLIGGALGHAMSEGAQTRRNRGETPTPPKPAWLIESEERDRSARLDTRKK